MDGWMNGRMDGMYMPTCPHVWSRIATSVSPLPSKGQPAMTSQPCRANNHRHCVPFLTPAPVPPFLPGTDENDCDDVDQA